MPLTSHTEKEQLQQSLLPSLRNVATKLRIASIVSTSTAGSGHVTSSSSAADILAVLFFHVMRYTPQDAAHPGNDRFVLSKGHAAPLLYASLAEAGFIRQEDLPELRTLGSPLEGHPTPRVPFVDVPTGSLGQGLSAGAGMALHAKRWRRHPIRVYVLLGDGELAEGAVWEAAEFAREQALDNLCAIVDVNRLGQSGPTRFQHDMEAYRIRWEAVGWRVILADGHDLESLIEAFERASDPAPVPTVVLARTFKGQGISSLEDKEGKHGKPLPSREVPEAVRALERALITDAPEISSPGPVEAQFPDPSVEIDRPMTLPTYALGDDIATRDAFGEAMTALGHMNPHIIGLDGDVKDSTRMQSFADAFPDRFVQCYIAEQNMVGVAMGLAARGAIPFASSFACFLTRAHDFIRMAAIGDANIKLVGSHAGVSIGQDGPSQMGLDDLAMMSAQPNAVVLYPSDGVATHRLVHQAANHRGLVYLRTTRGATPTLYSNSDTFVIGGSKILRTDPRDELTIVAAGITVNEALQAYEQLKKSGLYARVVDLYSIKPVDRATLVDCARATHGRIFTVEDHYDHGGIGDTVLSALSQERVRVHKLAIREIPRSGSPKELLDRYGISASSIVEAVRAHLPA